MNFKIGRIYLVTNLLNGKKYVGKTLKATKARWADHVKDARNNSMCILHKAVRKYGAQNFSVRTLKRCTEPLLDACETHFIRRHGSLGRHGYNMTPGGTGVPKTKAMIRKTSKALTGRTLSKARRESCKQSTTALWKTKKFRTKTMAGLRAAMSKSSYHKKLSDVQKRRWSDPWKRLKLGTSMRRRWSDPRKRAAQSKTGKIVWADAKLRDYQAENSRAQWADPVKRATMMAARLRNKMARERAV